MKLETRGQKIGVLFLTITILGLIFYFLYHFFSPYVSYINDYEKVRAWASESGLKGQLIYTFLVALQVIVAIIPGGPMEIGAGYAYGPILGTLLSLIGIVIGSILVYLLVKRFGRPFVSLFISEEKIDNLNLLKNPKRLNRIVFIVFLIPGTPKDLLTYAIGLTNMPLSTWLVLTTLARTPATFVSTYAGEAILKGDYLQVSLLFLFVMGLSLIGYRIFIKLNEKKEERKALRQAK